MSRTIYTKLDELTLSLTVRNLSDSPISLKFFQQSDKFMLLPFIKLWVPQQSDRHIVFPKHIDVAKAQIDNQETLENIKVHQLMTITEDRKYFASSYEPTSC